MREERLGEKGGAFFKVKKDGMILERYDDTDRTAIAIYFPNSLILCSSFKEQTSSCPFFSATI